MTRTHLHELLHMQVCPKKTPAAYFVSLQCLWSHSLMFYNKPGNYFVSQTKNRWKEGNLRWSQGTSPTPEAQHNMY